MLRELCEKIEYWLDGDESDPDLYLPLKICLLGFIVISIFVFIGVCTGALSVDVVKSENTPSLGVGTHSEFTGPNPVIDTNRRFAMTKEWKHYESNDGKLVVAYYGLSRPMNENDPFIEGYWISLDLYGSEQFIPKLEFEQEYHEVKKPK